MAEQTIVDPLSTEMSEIGFAGNRILSHRCVSYEVDKAWFFYMDEDQIPSAGAKDRLYATRTLDGGATWSNPRVLIAETVVAAWQFLGVSIWFDKWTQNLVNDDIHIVWCERFLNEDNIFNRTLDVTDGTMSAVTALGQGPGNFGGSTQWTARTAVCRTPDGVVWFLVMDTEYQTDGYWRMYNNSGGWSLVGAGTGTFGQWPGITPAYFEWVTLVPGWNGPMLIAALRDSSSDRAIYYGEFSLSTFQFGGVIEAFGDIHGARSQHQGISAVERHADGYIYVAYPTGMDSDSFDELRMARITGSSSHEIMTSPVVAPGSDEELGSVTLYCNQQFGHLYCGYQRGEDPGATTTCICGIRYKVSFDAAQSWLATEFDYSSSPDRDLQIVSSPPMGPGNEDGDLFLSFIDFDTDEWLCADFLPMDGYRVRDLDQGGGDQREVDCEHGNPIGGGGPVHVRPLNTQYPNEPAVWGVECTGTGTLWLRFADKVGSGTHNTGDEMRGPVSGATGTLAAYLEDVQLMGLTHVLPGPFSTPFLPNEEVDNLTEGGYMVLSSQVIAACQPARSSIGDKFVQSAPHAE